MNQRSVIFRMGELFCGPGGMAIGAHETKSVECKKTKTLYSINHSWGVDHSKPAINTFIANLGKFGAVGIHKDANEFVNDLKEENSIDALAFGFPCNSFSNVGERDGMNNTKFGELYKTGIVVIEKYSPQWFVAENVSGISGHDSGKQFKKILNELANAGMGYNVVANLYKFEEYGVPQSRHRYVIVGIRADIAKKDNLVFKIPAPTHGKGKKKFVSAQEALSKVKNTSHWGGEMTRQSDQVVWRLKFTKPWENAWILDEIVTWKDDKLNEYLRDLPWYDTEIKSLGSIKAIREKIEYARLHVKKARMSHIYKRLRADLPSYTLTGSGGGGTHVYHWEEHRALTNEERAALQTFPDDFEFCGSKEEVRKQIGMAVPTKGAKIIFESILKTFAKIEYDCIPANPDLMFYPQNM